jgi:flagellar basal-body rod modification protein FlgD
MTTAGAISSDPAITQAERGFGALDSDEFTQIILTELGNQDPLEPNDTSALLEQLSTIRSIESDTQLNDTLGSLVDRSDFTTAASLIGSRITTSDNPLTPREVMSVTQNSDGVSVTLDDGSFIPVSAISSVFGAGTSSPTEPTE